MWAVATTYNAYGKPERARIIYDMETGVWKFDESVQWLADQPVRIEGGGPWVTRTGNPSEWLRWLGVNYFRGAHLGLTIESYSSLDDLEPLAEAVLEEHPGHGSDKVHGRRFGAIAQATVEQGGFSANWIGHKPKSGYMVGGVVKPLHIGKPYGLGVSATGGVSSSTRAALGGDIKRFVHAHREELRKPGRYLGTWKDDDGSIWIDVSQRISTKAGANRIASARGEIAIYDVRKEDSYATPSPDSDALVPGGQT